MCNIMDKFVIRNKCITFFGVVEESNGCSIMMSCHSIVSYFGVSSWMFLLQDTDFVSGDNQFIKWFKKEKY